MTEQHSQQAFFPPVVFEGQRIPVPYRDESTRTVAVTVGIGTGLGYNSFSAGENILRAGYILTHLASGLALYGKTKVIQVADTLQEAQRWLIAVAALADWTRSEDELRATHHLPTLFEQIEDALRKVQGR